ncbi:(d)CMP kinase [Novibacillus thermophilus]|jgi:cytidylate kinase|uniref:Cytidylate kinase n=1 Tax=Novibacillus thermophilus TaxID=1471761 RepID=A0A1U9K9F4_9BACL|nr:(d)CMP kinase [Novibacillus thermophilus]AQS56651.1 cytidylate kinase [Novibacillus thermophilus]
MQKFNIAIDGPAGAGKSTVARLTAKRLNFQYIDTGAMYRAVTWEVLRRQIPMDDEQRIAEIAAEMDFSLETTASGTKIYVNGRDVTEEIRSEAVTSHVSAVAQLPSVRDVLVAKQQKMAAAGGVVMDGRDIGTKVLPEAEVKVLLTASIEERAKRRLHEMRAKGIQTDLERLKREIAARDKIDSERSVSPLRKAKDAVTVDTTGMTIEQVVENILDLSRTKVGPLE